MNVQRWERSVQDEEDFLQRCKQAEAKHKAEIEADKQKIEQLKQEKNEKKKVVDQMEEETAKVRCELECRPGQIHNFFFIFCLITGTSRCSRTGQRIAQHQLCNFDHRHKDRDQEK